MSDQSAELWTRTFCPQCGWDVDTDEDGLCQVCGAEAVGEGVEDLCQEVDRIATLEAHLTDAHHHLAEAHRDNDALRRENTELRGQLARALADKPKEVFTAEEVAALQAHQNRHDRHPLTCQCSGSNVLVPTRMGLICPAGCGYIQTWAPNVCLMPPDALADKEAPDAP